MGSGSALCDRWEQEDGRGRAIQVESPEPRSKDPEAGRLYNMPIPGLAFQFPTPQACMRGAAHYSARLECDSTIPVLIGRKGASN